MQRLSNPTTSYKKIDAQWYAIYKNGSRRPVNNKELLEFADKQRKHMKAFFEEVYSGYECVSSVSLTPEGNIRYQHRLEKITNIITPYTNTYVRV
jgi:hypothetical protein